MRLSQSILNMIIIHLIKRRWFLWSINTCWTCENSYILRLCLLRKKILKSTQIYRINNWKYAWRRCKDNSTWCIKYIRSKSAPEGWNFINKNDWFEWNIGNLELLLRTERTNRNKFRGFNSLSERSESFKNLTFKW